MEVGNPVASKLTIIDNFVGNPEVAKLMIIVNFVANPEVNDVTKKGTSPLQGIANER
jgi:hypothetical protein